ncbi:hypothetical protein H0H93_012160 [Arthromyces matolae]|nr:hypothetical protein H0H93_012160 [Arthromyces matolae]
MALYTTDFQKLWRDGRFFAQIPVHSILHDKAPSDGTLVGEVIAVANQLVGGAYKLGNVSPSFKPSKDLEVFEVLTQASIPIQILPTLSEQSTYFWDRAARPLASQLATARYPIRSQASHLVFWWARIGGLMGVTSIEARVGCQGTSATTDGSNIEYSWSIPRTTDPLADSNRKIRFSIDPYHPEQGHRIPGGGVLDYLLSDEGSLGLIQNEPGNKEWKRIIEQFLFPDVTSEESLDGTTYGVAFDMTPSGAIGLKMYYVPPLPPPAGVESKTRVTVYRRAANLEPMMNLAYDLHPLLKAPFRALIDYTNNEGKSGGMAFSIIAFDIARPEKNRVKLYMKIDRTKLSDIISDMTLGGRITGPQIEDAMANLTKFFKRLFPYVNDEDPELKVLPLKPEPNGIIDPRKTLHMLYYYEFVIGEPLPYAKVYFFMDRLGTNDYETARATELFLRDAGKPGEEGWMVNGLAHAYSHRPLEARTGIHTAVGFATKPRGWEVINYYTPEFFATDRVDAKPATNGHR